MTRIRGGMPIGPDGRIHATLTMNPSTLRTACQHPPLQQLPRSRGPEDPETWVRKLIVAGPGSMCLTRDFSGIEAVLTGFFALSPQYIRLAKIDVHTFYTVHALYDLEGPSGRVRAVDLPDLSWPDDRLIDHLAALKKVFKADRNTLYKHLVHAGNYAQTPKGAADKIFAETGVEVPVPKIATVMDLYFSLFPEIRRWHAHTLLEANDQGYLRNPFGYVHRFHKVYDWEKIGGRWQRSPGPQANEAIAFKPQSTAAGIIKEVMLRLYFDRFEEIGQYLRLIIHDELLLEVPMGEADRVDQVLKHEMERPVHELPLPETYGMGPYLNILTEGKRGVSWGGLE